MTPHFIIIGLDDAQSPQFSEEIRQLIRENTVFSGGRRHRQIVQMLLPEGHKWIDVTVPLSSVFAQYEKTFTTTDTIVVFTSGDPLFFGFGNTILREMPTAHIKTFPTFNSLQTLAHKALMRYDDMTIVSLTGRPWQEFDRALIERNHKIGILTDHSHTPSAIAIRMLDYGFSQYKMLIGEHLGNETRERVRTVTLQEAVNLDVESPNCIILIGEALNVRPFGISDEEFALLDGRRRMITKMPIRLLTLQALNLRSRHTLWDVGFCTGSVSIEARIQFPHLTVHSFEVRAECEELMAVNSRRFGAPGINVHMGDFLELEVGDIAAPDAVFIGGHGGKLKEFIEKIYFHLCSEGCIVFNSVSEESKNVFTETVARLGMKMLASHQITIDSYNQITIMTAIKE